MGTFINYSAIAMLRVRRKRALEDVTFKPHTFVINRGIKNWFLGKKRQKVDGCRMGIKSYSFHSDGYFTYKNLTADELMQYLDENSAYIDDDHVAYYYPYVVITLNNGQEIKKTFTTVGRLEAWLTEARTIVLTIKELI